MKGLINVLGILMIIFGIAVLSYQGLEYLKPGALAMFGDLTFTIDILNKFLHSPAYGIIALVCGIFMVVLTKE